MKNEWIKADPKIKILGKRCLRHRQDARERILVGKYGVIYPYSNKEYMVVIMNAQIGNKHLEGITMKMGEEVGLKVNKREALLWLQILKVSRVANTQLKNVEKLL